MDQPTFSAIHHTATYDWKSRSRAAAVHLGLSVLVAGLAGLLVFFLWYPYPYREVSGGRGLFALVVSVDVVLGPLVTLAIFDRSKGWPVLRRDLVVVALLQLAGLAYGLYTVQIARPVHLVFEYDRFRVVHGVDIPAQLADRAPPGIEVTPWLGPTPISLRPFRNEEERVATTMAAFQGVALAARPDLWETYDAGRNRIIAAAKPVAELKSRFPQQAAEIDAAARRAGRDPARTAYLPMIARKADAWTVLLDGGTADVIAYLPLDSF